MHGFVARRLDRASASSRVCLPPYLRQDSDRKSVRSPLQKAPQIQTTICMEAMAPTIRAALLLIYAPTLFLYDRAAVHVIRGFTATGIWPMQTSQPESDNGSEIGDADMPDLVWDHYG